MQGLLFVAAFLLNASQPVGPSADFAIRFDHKGCHCEYLDTFRGTYSHVGAVAPVAFTMPAEQRRTLFRAILNGVRVIDGESELILKVWCAQCRLRSLLLSEEAT